jgi:hypothetical protein
MAQLLQMLAPALRRQGWSRRAEPRNSIDPKRR